MSTGRTGTQFFEEYFNNTTDSAICKHEPKPSRRFKFLSNLYLSNKISDDFIISIYNSSRKTLFRTINFEEKIYIESSNFIFGCIPAINKFYNNIKIIHIVRHPITYIESHLNHGFWKGHKKYFAKYVPYWLEKIDAKKTSNPVLILMERWRFVNKQIKLYCNTNDYLLVKFEDLFNNKKQIGAVILNDIRDFCGLEKIDDDFNVEWLSTPKNKSESKFLLSESDKEQILEILQHDITEYYYE